MRPNEQRAKTAIVLIWVVLAINIIMLISDYLEYTMLQTISNGGEVSTEAANANDMRQLGLAGIYTVVFIISIVTFIQWFRRAYYNLHTKVRGLRYTEGWAAGGWFVPIMSLFVPYQIMKELYRETERLLSEKTENYTGKTSLSYVGWWWGLWIVSNVIGQITFRVALEAETADELTMATVVSMMSSIIGIPLALLAIKVIKDYADIEPLLGQLKEEPVAPALS